VSQDFSVSLKADNGKYLSVIERPGGIRNIEAEKSQQDVWTHFEVHTIDSNHVYLKSADGKYLSRIHRGGVDNIEAIKPSPDVFCKFRVHEISPVEVVYQADNGLYLGRVYRHGQENIEAVKSIMDSTTRFEVQHF